MLSRLARSGIFPLEPFSQPILPEERVFCRAAPLGRAS